MNTPRYTADQMITAIRAARGIKAAAARALGCSRSTIDNYIRRYDTVAEAYEEARNTLLDDAESAMAALIDAHEWPAVRFILATLGKDRGYTERTETAVQVAGDHGETMLAQFDAALVKVYGANAALEMPDG